MKNYKNIMILGLILIIGITTVACSGGKPVESTSTVPTTEDTEKVATPKKDTLAYEFYEIHEKPEILKEFTNMDADYSGYLKSNAFRILFLDQDRNLTDEIDVYTLPKSEDATALYLYQKNNKVVNAKLDAFNGDVNIEGYNYDTLIYNYDNNIENQMKEANFPYDLLNKKEDAEKTLKSKFEGKSLNDLQKFLNVYTPVQKYCTKDTDKNLQTYAVVSEVGYTASQTINVIIADNKIEKLYIDEIYKPNNDPIETLKSAK